MIIILAVVPDNRILSLELEINPRMVNLNPTSSNFELDHEYTYQ